MGIWSPSNTRFIGPTRVHSPNGILIGSAVFAGLATRFVTIGRIYVRSSTAMQSNNTGVQYRFHVLCVRAYVFVKIRCRNNIPVSDKVCMHIIIPCSLRSVYGALEPADQSVPILPFLLLLRLVLPLPLPRTSPHHTTILVQVRLYTTIFTERFIKITVYHIIYVGYIGPRCGHRGNCLRT